MHNSETRPHTTTSCARILALALALNHVFAGTTQAAPRRHELRAPQTSRTHTSQAGTHEAAADAHVNWKDTAHALDLGSRHMASHLLTRPPSRAVRNAAQGDGATRLLWPVATGNFVRGFGLVRKVRKDLPHLGVDIAAPTGTPILAAADGIVGYANHGVKGYGNLAILVHADGSVTSYAHCNKLRVEPGQPVTRGQVIAEVGSTGISRGPHLHFEFRSNGRPRNPMARFDRPTREPEALPALAMVSVTSR